MATVDRRGRIADSNARFARLFHPVFKGEARGDRSILSVVAERDRGALEAAIRNAAEGQSEIDPVEAALARTRERSARLLLTPRAGEKQTRRRDATVQPPTTTQRP